MSCAASVSGLHAAKCSYIRNVDGRMKGGRRVWLWGGGVGVDGGQDRQSRVAGCVDRGAGLLVLRHAVWWWC